MKLYILLLSIIAFAAANKSTRQHLNEDNNDDIDYDKQLPLYSKNSANKHSRKTYYDKSSKMALGKFYAENSSKLRNSHLREKHNQGKYRHKDNRDKARRVGGNWRQGNVANQIIPVTQSDNRDGIHEENSRIETKSVQVINEVPRNRYVGNSVKRQSNIISPSKSSSARGRGGCNIRWKGNKDSTGKDRKYSSNWNKGEGQNNRVSEKNVNNLDNKPSSGKQDNANNKNNGGEVKSNVIGEQKNGSNCHDDKGPKKCASGEENNKRVQTSQAESYNGVNGRKENISKGSNKVKSENNSGGSANIVHWAASGDKNKEVNWNNEAGSDNGKNQGNSGSSTNMKNQDIGSSSSYWNNQINGYYLNNMGNQENLVGWKNEKDQSNAASWNKGAYQNNRGTWNNEENQRDGGGWINGGDPGNRASWNNYHWQENQDPLMNKEYQGYSGSLYKNDWQVNREPWVDSGYQGNRESWNYDRRQSIQGSWVNGGDHGKTGIWKSRGKQDEHSEGCDIKELRSVAGRTNGEWNHIAYDRGIATRDGGDSLKDTNDGSIEKASGAFGRGGFIGEAGAKSSNGGFIASGIPEVFGGRYTNFGTNVQIGSNMQHPPLGYGERVLEGSGVRFKPLGLGKDTLDSVKDVVPGNNQVLGPKDFGVNIADDVNARILTVNTGEVAPIGGARRKAILKVNKGDDIFESLYKIAKMGNIEHFYETSTMVDAEAKTDTQAERLT